MSTKNKIHLKQADVLWIEALFLQGIFQFHFTILQHHAWSINKKWLSLFLRYGHSCQSRFFFIKYVLPLELNLSDIITGKAGRNEILHCSCFLLCIRIRIVFIVNGIRKYRSNGLLVWLSYPQILQTFCL